MVNSFKLVLNLFAILLFTSQAQQSCTGTLSSPNPITSDVNVPNGASCTLATSVTGSISIGSGASFFTTGSVQISGGVTGSGVSQVNLGGTVTINGATQITGATTGVTIGSGVNAGSVSVADSDIVHSGTVTSLSSSGVGTISLTGGSILGGGLAKSGSGNVNACGATISGGVSFTEATSSFNAIATSSCAASSITGSISLSKGTGDLTITGAELMAADINVVEMVGDVEITDAVVSDILVSTLDGSFSLNAAADSDTTLQGITGPIALNGFEGQGDFSIIGAQSTIDVTNSKFGNEQVSISGAVAKITMIGNMDFSVLLENNPDIQFDSNTVLTAEFKGNTDINLNNNNFVSLICASNTNESGTGNTALANNGCGALLV